ncbi:hypothetical protein JI435_414420, partial [Parastagonospora nodorum SN15]
TKNITHMRCTTNTVRAELPTSSTTAATHHSESVQVNRPVGGAPFLSTFPDYLCEGICNNFRSLYHRAVPRYECANMRSRASH